MAQDIFTYTPISSSSTLGKNIFWPLHLALGWSHQSLTAQTHYLMVLQKNMLLYQMGSMEFLTAVIQSSQASTTSLKSFPTIPGSILSTDYHTAQLRTCQISQVVFTRNCLYHCWFILNQAGKYTFRSYHHEHGFCCWNPKQSWVLSYTIWLNHYSLPSNSDLWHHIWHISDISYINLSSWQSILHTPCYYTTVSMTHYYPDTSNPHTHFLPVSLFSTLHSFFIISMCFSLVT